MTLDLAKKHAAEYVAPKTPQLLAIGKARYLAITGMGDPKAAAFQERMNALYMVATMIKIDKKKAGRDFVVGKLESQWWVNETKRGFMDVPPADWHWILLIRTPLFVSRVDLVAAKKRLRAAGKPKAVADVRLGTLDMGRCVQMLHVGPYTAEAPSIAMMKAFAAKQGLKLHGRHHEVYLNDPRKVAPDKLKTILRLRVK